VRIRPLYGAILGFTTMISTSQAATDLSPFFKPGAIRVLILSGRNNHDWRQTTPFLRQILEATGRFDVRVVEEAAGLSDEALEPYDVIVSDYNGPRWPSRAEAAVEAFVRSGKGLVVVHAASYAFGEMEVLGPGHRRTGLREPAWRPWAEMVGASWTEGPPRSGHAPRHVFEVKLVDQAHPITQGLPPSFRISDELYHNLVLRPGIHLLATAYDDPKIGGTGREEPLLWVLNYGQGRIFHTALGHDVAAMQAPGFVTTFARGVEWAATGKVTLPAEIHWQAPKQNPLRVQLVVGGHDFEPSLFHLFEGWPDITTRVVWQPEAYTRGRLDRTDVLVLYDMTQEMTEEARRNLQQYLESGRGLVVLHHAIASNQKWEWWWREVVGGRYVLEGYGATPSQFKEGIEMVVEPVARHPVVTGIPPMQIWDEAYKNMWLSPKIQVLLRTNHPAADGPMAWVGPYEKARVVYIQLGHGSEAHYHPHFRQLVHNAILWVAGRAKE